MHDADKTKAQLLAELHLLGQRNTTLEVAATAQQQTEMELRQSEERYRILVECSLQGISVFDLQGNRLFANQALATMLGYDQPAPLIGKRADPHLYPHEVERLEGYRRARLQGQPVPSRYEVEGVKRDGTTIWMEQLVSPIQWQHEPALMIATLDITERKRLEDRLRQTQKLEAMGTLAGGIAHDFNNMLAVLTIHTELAQSYAQQDSELWESLQALQTVAARAKDLVQQILTFSRQVETQRRLVGVSAVIEDTFRLIRASLPATIEIQSRLLNAGDTIRIDPTQLHQIVLNLCTNAEHAMRGTSGVLAIGVAVVVIDNRFAMTLPTLAPGSYVRLTLRDSGHGMSPEIIERIFDPFFTTKDVGEGTGMGLAVVHGIVVQAGGAIIVDSTPGEGSQFTLYFPCIDNEGQGFRDDSDALPHGAGRLLLVDDEAMLTHGLHQGLARLGYEVVSRTSALEALEVFRGDPQRFDLLITDQTMPQMTGEQLSQEVRRLRADLPIILCTGFSHTMNPDKASDLGIDAFCTKPLTAQELGATIERVLQQRATFLKS